MNYNIVVSPLFEKKLKNLAKKHRSIKKDLLELLKKLSTDPRMGVEVFDNCFKIRMAISSKGKGKSAGARVITYFQVKEDTIYLVFIYDKSEQSTIKESEIKDLLNQI